MPYEILEKYANMLINNPKEGWKKASEEIFKKYGLKIVSYDNRLKYLLIAPDSVLKKVDFDIRSSNLKVNLIKTLKGESSKRIFNVPAFVYEIENIPPIFDYIYTTRFDVYNDGIIRGVFEHDKQQKLILSTINYPFYMTAGTIKEQIEEAIKRDMKLFTIRDRVQPIREMLQKYIDKFKNYEYSGINNIIDDVVKPFINISYRNLIDLYFVKTSDNYYTSKELYIDAYNSGTLVTSSAEITLKLDYDKLLAKVTPFLQNTPNYYTRFISRLNGKISKYIRKKDSSVITRVNLEISEPGHLLIQIPEVCNKIHISNKDGQPKLLGVKNLKTIDKRLDNKLIKIANDLNKAIMDTLKDFKVLQSINNNITNENNGIEL